MIASYTAHGSVELKTKNISVVLANGVSVGSQQIAGPGEYDVQGVQCEATAYEGGIGYFVRVEDMVTAYLTKVDATASKLDGITEAAILVLDVRSDDTNESVKALIKAVEPSYVLLAGAGATKEMAAALGFPLTEGSSLKVTKAGLPLEGTSLILAD